MSEQKNYITHQGLKKLLEEQSLLLHTERPKVVEAVAWAASNGDRSENADYIYGKKRLRQIDSRLLFLQKRIEMAQVVDLSLIKTDKVVFGVWVTYEDEEGDLHSYQIVGEDEWDIERKKISWQSPVAKALLGKKMGERVLITKPGLTSEVEIIKIEARLEGE